MSEAITSHDRKPSPVKNGTASCLDLELHLRLDLELNLRRLQALRR